LTTSYLSTETGAEDNISKFLFCLVCRTAFSLSRRQAESGTAVDSSWGKVSWVDQASRSQTELIDRVRDGKKKRKMEGNEDGRETLELLFLMVDARASMATPSNLWKSAE